MPDRPDTHFGAETEATLSPLILVADDDDHFRDWLSQSLHDVGFTSGDQAVKLCETMTPAALVMDYKFGDGLNGA
jgi:CheY-like chemotaxis protein